MVGCGASMHRGRITFKTVSVFEHVWERLLTYALILIGTAIVILFADFWFAAKHVPRNFTGILHLLDYVLFGAVTFVVWYQIMNEILSWDLALSMRHPVPVMPEPGRRVALLTAFVPGKEPLDMLEKTLMAMVAVRYPHDTWLLDEGDDDDAKQLCRALGVRHFTRKGRPEFNQPSGTYAARTKSGNYNAWFAEHGSRYEFIAQHDMDFVPLPEYLEETLGYFRDPNVAFVGTPQIYGNDVESWIARGAAEQAYGFYGPIQKGLFGKDMHLFIGANHVIRAEAHDDIEGYAGHIVEDHLTGMRLYRRAWKSVYVPKVLLVGEGPSTWDAYFSQQMRWAYGLIDILFRHSPSIIPGMKPLHAIRYFLMQQYYFYGLAQAVGIALIALYFFTGTVSTTMDTAWLLFYYSSFLLMQIVIFLWLQRFYIRPAHESGFHIAGKLLNIAAWPIYLIAFFGALTGRRLSYRVTPKGGAQSATHDMDIFLPHAILGTISLVALVYGFLEGRNAPVLTFWAALNTVFMYGFVAFAFLQIRRASVAGYSRRPITRRRVA